MPVKLPPGRDRVAGAGCDHGRHAGSLGRRRGRIADGNHHIDVGGLQLLHQLRHQIDLAHRGAALLDNILSKHIAAFCQRIEEHGARPGAGNDRHSNGECPDAIYFRGLGQRRERPRDRPSTDTLDQIAPMHWSLLTISVAAGF
jgi:hypothetical protein